MSESESAEGKEKAARRQLHGEDKQKKKEEDGVERALKLTSFGQRRVK